MCADAAKPSAERFRYSDAASGLYRIGKEEGIRVFGRGLSANIVRSVLMSKSLAGLPQLSKAARAHPRERCLADRAVSKIPRDLETAMAMS